MRNIPPDILILILFGAFAMTAGGLVLYYRKNFALYKGLAILLFAVGTSSCATALMSGSDLKIIFVLYWFSRGTIPIFLLLFSEYILKINYHITIKLLILSVTWILVIGAFFQTSVMQPFYVDLSNIFYLLVIVIITIKTAVRFVASRERLLKIYLLIFLVTMMLVFGLELVHLFGGIRYRSYSIGISTLIITHGIILIITSGGYSRLKHKLPILLYMVLFSIALCVLLKLAHSEIELEYLVTLLVLSLGVLSIYYLIGEVSRGPKKIGSALLISRLLSLPLHDKELFLEELRKWEEIHELNFIEHNRIEGSISDLNSLFSKAGRAIHKSQVNTLRKALAFNAGFISGIEIAQFYFKKFDCQSLFQISEKGDFIAIKYMKGLNPALYANELSLMTKIVFSASSNPKQI